VDRNARKCRVTIAFIIDTVWAVLQDIHCIVQRVVDKLWADGTKTYAHRMY